jgi:hypothetical protein
MSSLMALPCCVLMYNAHEGAAVVQRIAPADASASAAGSAGAAGAAKSGVVAAGAGSGKAAKQQPADVEVMDLS